MFEKMIVNLAKDYMKKYDVKIKYVMLSDISLTIQFGGNVETLEKMYDYLEKFKKEVENE